MTTSWVRSMARCETGRPCSAGCSAYRLAVQELLAARCAIAAADRTTREPGVRLRR
ncbi:DUF6207 family protein [Streptomyces sp. NPDC102405]|uniref:DUF6207 family protein n=1 Tax=Streptomyces sp. NPDC102405 TaxID=3366170 RepID=UPI00382F640A